MEELRVLLTPYYLEVKTLHLLSIAVWSFSTAVAYRDYVLPAFLSWQADRDNREKRARRDWIIERFDRGAQLEHVAFPIAILTGLTLVWLSGWSLVVLNWLTLKVAIMVLVFIPVEFVDYYLSHFGGNKRRIRSQGDGLTHERMVLLHWRFLRLTAPLVIVFVPLLFYLAVVKPVI